MEERAREAARIGDIDVLYELIWEKPDFLHEVEGREFYDTPLHVAAASGRTEFAMELLGLKPSLAMKLNQDGWSPLHLALKNGDTETAFSLLEFNKDLARVKGNNGYTPFHLAVTMGDSIDHLTLLTTILNDCPKCIHDVTNRNDTALHLAAGENKLKAFQVLLRSLLSSECSTRRIKKLLNFKNRNGDTVLHIAASKNQPKILGLLTRWGVDIRLKNSNKLTATEILEQSENQQDSKECLRILRSQRKNIFQSPFLFIFYLVRQLASEAKNMSSERSNALVVVTVLILTATYQAALSPPGGVFQANSQNNTSPAMDIHSGSKNSSTGKLNKFLEKGSYAAGSSVLSTRKFLWFFIPNIGAFCISFIVTCFVLISNLTVFFWSTLIVALTMLLFCLLVSAVMVISPNTESADIMFQYVYILAYFLSGLMYIIILVVVFIRVYCRIKNKRYARQKP
ncbi:ankyrin repeat-containing protein BDA1-like [Hibiscus syriacus]|nr:ankyrin repeat-containing protein BDA1-like [Hibiscus syriacus]